jgi:hypothetical protein
MAYGVRLSQAGQAPGYEKLCEAIVEAFRVGVVEKTRRPAIHPAADQAEP